MDTQKASISKILPVLIGFFVMGFVDLVGIATNYVKADFNLSDTMANLLPSMVFFWFLVCAVPTALLMNKIGRKNTVRWNSVPAVRYGNLFVANGDLLHRSGPRFVDGVVALCGQLEQARVNRTLKR